MNLDKHFYFNRRKQRLFYSLLLIATPFLLLQNYLQSFIGQLSHIEFTLFDKNIPVIPTVAFILLLFLVIWLRKKFTQIRIVGWIAIFAMFRVGQYLTDFYFHHQFYDLQYNWHYLAYAIFAYLNYRYLKEKKTERSKILLSTFFMALTISSFDEMIQIPLSNRVFDIGDVSKDLWGTFVGLIFVFMVIENGNMFMHPFKLRHPKLKDYLADSVSLFFYLLLFTLLFLAFTAVLSDTRYLFQAVAYPVSLFLLIFGLIHFSQFKKARVVVVAIILFVVGGLTLLQLKYHDKGIVALNNNLVLYKGIPVYYLDILIYPDHTFRPVDKKAFFNQRDKRTIKQLSEDILLIASGTNGDGGRGFFANKQSGFVYNKFKNRGLQVIILKNDMAFAEYNRLMAEGKRVTLIVKND